MVRKMSLTCPICGKKYSHDRKICQTCEEKSIYSGLTNKDNEKVEKWNCGIFLELDTLTFGKRKLDDAYIKIASEPRFTDFKHRKDYYWNCDSNFGFRNRVIQHIGGSSFKTVRNLPFNNSGFIRKDINNFLIYE